MTTLDEYRAACAAKRPVPLAHGLSKIPALNSTLFPHQAHGVEFALRSGRAAAFYDTGLGKTRIMLEFGRCVVEATNKPVLMLAPLAVSAQHIREAEAMGVGSEGYVALRHRRKFIGTELKESYFRQACKYLDEAERLGPSTDLLASLTAAE